MTQDPIRYIQASRYAALRMAGTTPKEAAKISGLTPKKGQSWDSLDQEPEITQASQALRERMFNRTGLTLEAHAARLKSLADKAESMGMISVAVRAEELRGKAHGLYVEKTQQIQDVTSMNQGQIEAELHKLLGNPAMKNMLQAILEPVKPLEDKEETGPVH